MPNDRARARLIVLIFTISRETYRSQGKEGRAKIVPVFFFFVIIIVFIVRRTASSERTLFVRNSIRICVIRLSLASRPLLFAHDSRNGVHGSLVVSVHGKELYGEIEVAYDTAGPNNPGRRRETCGEIYSDLTARIRGISDGISPSKRPE